MSHARLHRSDIRPGQSPDRQNMRCSLSRPRKVDNPRVVSHCMPSTEIQVDFCDPVRTRAHQTIARALRASWGRSQGQGSCQ